MKNLAFKDLESYTEEQNSQLSGDLFSALIWDQS